MDIGSFRFRVQGLAFRVNCLACRFVDLGWILPPPPPTLRELNLYEEYRNLDLH